MQRKFRFAMVSTVLIVLGMLVGPAGAREALSGPQASPCAPGAVYNPACDVDHDNDVDIIDIQLAAGHWNQSGAWVSDNGHSHLGQTWTGDSVPLRIQGSYGPPVLAPIVLSNSHAIGSGLRVESVAENALDVDTAGRAVYVDTTTYTAMYVGHAGYDAYAVCRTGSAVGCTHSDNNNGLEVANAEDDGVHVVKAGGDGLFVCQTGTASGCTPDTGRNGLEVGNAQSDGVHITDAGDDAIQVGQGTNFPNYGLYVPTPGTGDITLWPNTAVATGQWALYTTDNIEAGNVFASAQTLVAVVPTAWTP